MKQAVRMLTAAALILTIFGLPVSLEAARYRGAALIITLLNGSQVRGELIAVKPASLLLLGLDYKDTSVAIADVATIRIVRRSQAWQGLLYGFLPGAVGGAILGAIRDDEDWAAVAAVYFGALFGAATGLVGTVVGMAAGMDTEFALAGLSDAETDQILDRLNRQAREPGVYTPGTRVRNAGAGGSKEVHYAQKWPRFRLAWLPGLRIGEVWSLRKGVVSFRFTDDLSPGEAGPYPSTFYMEENSRPTFAFGCLTLTYQWSRRLAAEIEWSASSYRTAHFADLQFTSTIDGMTYWAYFGATEMTRATSLLFGLSFRPLTPATLQPHAVEIGLAAGPAFTRTRAYESWAFDDGVVVDRSTIWTARLRASYDYHFGPGFSMGAFAEYRWLQADLPARELSELLDFSPDYSHRLIRTTAVSMPERTVAMGGFACGLKLGFGF